MYRIATTILLAALVGVVVGLTSDPPEGTHSTPVLQDQRIFEGVDL